MVKNIPMMKSNDERIDQDRLQELALLAEHSGAKVINQLIADFFSDAQALLASLRRDLMRDDRHAGKMRCHEMKGMLANFGLTAGAQVCETLGQALESGVDGSGLVNQIAIEVEAAQAVFDRFFKLD